VQHTTDEFELTYILLQFQITSRTEKLHMKYEGN